MTPLARTMALLQANGWLVERVERWNSFSKTKNDLFGVVDVLALREGTMGIQVTTAANVAARRKKILKSPNTPKMLAAGWDVLIHGWAKKKGRWVLARIDLIDAKDCDCYKNK